MTGRALVIHHLRPVPEDAATAVLIEAGFQLDRRFPIEGDAMGCSSTLVSERVWRVLEQGTDELGPIGHGWTYSAHPICAAAGRANLKLIDDLGLVENAREVGSHLSRAMSEALADHPKVGEGLLCAVEFVEDKETRRFFGPARKAGARVAAARLEEGVIGRAMPEGDILGFAPPLCLSREEAETVVSATRRAVETVVSAL